MILRQISMEKQFLKEYFSPWLNYFSNEYIDFGSRCRESTTWCHFPKAVLDVNAAQLLKTTLSVSSVKISCDTPLSLFTLVFSLHLFFLIKKGTDLIEKKQEWNPFYLNHYHIFQENTFRKTYGVIFKFLKGKIIFLN